jgi:nucleotide-binding universal stress UspA family protein
MLILIVVFLGRKHKQVCFRFVWFLFHAITFISILSFGTVIFPFTDIESGIKLAVERYMSPDQFKYQMAIHDFQSARQRAAVQEILARVTGKSNQLLSYEEVAEKLKLHVRTERGVQHIPLDAIVGSVGRNTEFTRTFLPRHGGDQQRWANVKTVFMDASTSLPPIEVYKVGEVYFVVDGNHRVSIAKQEGFPTIEARVIEFKTDISLTPDVEPDDLIIKAEYVEFLDATRVHEARPNVDLSVTTCCQYDTLMEQVRVCQYLLQEGGKRDATLQDSAVYWYDTMYIPLADAIRDRGLLHWFPGNTITDLYIWISQNRAALEEELGWEIQSTIAATDLILERSVKTEPGSWRKARIATRYIDRLFEDILVPLSGGYESWASLDQAIIIAQREKARIHGLHIVDSPEKIESPDTQAVQAQFNHACVSANVDGKLFIEAGEVTKKIYERATMTDLIVLRIFHPPTGRLSSLTSPFRTIIFNSSRPVLGVPGTATSFQRALLAYDGSDQAKEALFVATYLAEIWKTQLLVFTAWDGTKVKTDSQDYVRKYLDIHELDAEYIVSEQGAMEYLKKAVEEHNVDLVLMGSHGGSTLQQVFTGSALDYMLRESKAPIFICR